MKQASPSVTGWRRSYVLLLLTLVYVVNYLDRQILGILLPAIEQEFHFGDAEAGLLSGTVFAVVYATLGIPLAALADRVSRRNIIVCSLFAFSLMTVLSGFVTRYWQLIVTRFGTGIGEAGTSPSINAMLSDLYPPQQRAGALAFYSAGLNVGLLCGFFGGGWLLQNYGWRIAFIASGVPGIVLALLLLLTVAEPVRGAADQQVDSEPVPSLRAVGVYLAQIPSFRWLALGGAMSAVGGYAGVYFIPKYLMVSHHMTPAMVGIALALLVGVLGAVGTYVAGILADRFSLRDVRWYMWLPAVGAVIALPFTAVFYLVDHTALALAAAAVPAVTGAAYLGPGYAMSQSLVPLRMRAQSVAILLFILNMLGLGLGPLCVGLISDALRPVVGADSLRYALLCTMVTSLAGALCYWRAARTLAPDLARAGTAQVNGSARRAS